MNARFRRRARAILFTAAALAIVGAASAAQVAGPKLRWDVSLWGKPRAGTAIAELLAAEVGARTDGNWRIVLHYGEAISKARENLDGIAIGAFEGALICNFYHPRKNPALMVLTMPFLPMRNAADALRVREAVLGHAAVREELKRWNAMPYATAMMPQYEFLGRGEPPTRLEDWRGLTVRAGGGLGQAMRRVGATPTSSAATEVYTGVQQGTMDAAAFPFTYSHISYRIHEVSNWFTGNLSPGTSECPLVFNIDAHEALAPQYKALLKDIRDSLIQGQIQAYVDVDKENLPMLKRTLLEVRYSDEELARFRALAGQPVIDDWIAENQHRFDARGLVETIYAAVGQSYPPAVDAAGGP